MFKSNGSKLFFYKHLHNARTEVFLNVEPDFGSSFNIRNREFADTFLRY